MTKLESLIKNLKKANQRLKEAIKAKPTRMNKDATIQRQVKLLTTGHSLLKNN